jgi:hypothetical protein
MVRPEPSGPKEEIFQRQFQFIDDRKRMQSPALPKAVRSAARKHSHSTASKRRTPTDSFYSESLARRRILSLQIRIMMSIKGRFTRGADPDPRRRSRTAKPNTNTQTSPEKKTINSWYYHRRYSNQGQQIYSIRY